MVLLFGAEHKELYEWVEKDLAVFDDVSASGFVFLIPSETKRPRELRVAGILDREYSSRLTSPGNRSAAENLAEELGAQSKMPCALAYDHQSSEFDVIRVDLDNPRALFGLLRTAFDRTLKGADHVIKKCRKLRELNRKLLASDDALMSDEDRLSLAELIELSHQFGSELPSFRKHLARANRNYVAQRKLTNPVRYVGKLIDHWLREASRR